MLQACVHGNFHKTCKIQKKSFGGESCRITLHFPLLFYQLLIGRDHRFSNRIFMNSSSSMIKLRYEMVIFSDESFRKTFTKSRSKLLETFKCMENSSSFKTVQHILSIERGGNIRRFRLFAIRGCSLRAHGVFNSDFCSRE